jgi:PAS domain S-box-containing protein
MTIEMTSPLRILHLEADPLEAQRIHSALDAGGLAVTITGVSTREEFASALESGPFQLILTNDVLADLDGQSALELARVKCPETPVVFVSSNADLVSAVEALKQGAADYVPTSHLERLAQSVNRALQEAQEQAERKRNAAAQLKTQDRLKELLAWGPAVIYSAKATGDFGITFVSENVTAQLGYAAAEFLEESSFWITHVHPEDAPRVLAELPHLFESENHIAEYRFLSPDGSYRWLRDEMKLVRDEEGHPREIVGSWFDITVRKEAEEQIREQAALLDQAQDAISVCDLDGCVRYWNRGAEKLYGWTAAEMLGQKAAEKLYQANYSLPAEARRQTLVEGAWSGELTPFSKSRQNLIVQSRWTLLSDPTGSPKSFLVVETDVTEQKRFATELLRVQRLESIGRLAGGIAHDLNNVLAPILMGARILRDELQSESARSMLATMEASAERGAGIVKQVLTFARGMGGQKVALQPLHLIKDMAKIIRETFPKSLTLQTKFAKDIWMVSGDATQLHQVLLNLGVNARDAMADGGILTLAAENVRVDENLARGIPDARAGDYVLIRVSDTGTGIPPEIMDKIFDPFFTTKGPEKGTGLGLSTVLGIVKSHEGFIQVLSQVGRGTEFKIYLPAVAGAQAVPGVPEAKPLPHGHGELVLFVDDEDGIRTITKQTLEKFGYQVLTAADGTEALALFMQHRTEIKVVLTDMIMPYMDGPATIRALQKVDPQVKIIAATGHGSSPKLTEASMLGVGACLRKPFTTEVLLGILQEVLQKESGPPDISK